MEAASESLGTLEIAWDRLGFPGKWTAETGWNEKTPGAGGARTWSQEDHGFYRTSSGGNPASGNV